MEAAHRGGDHREHLAGHLRLVATVHGCATPDHAVVDDVHVVVIPLVHVLGARVHLDLELLSEHSEPVQTREPPA